MIKRETSRDAVVLLVEGDILVRHPLAEYLRQCGFIVFEAASGDEAMLALGVPDLTIEIVIVDMTTTGSGFALGRWIREHHSGIEVVLAGSIEKAVDQAGSICNQGPALTKPYEHRLVLDRIRQFVARRENARP
jgi:DNA-binding response OmpR family regulator